MISVITLFSGYDSQCLALNRLGVEYDLVAWCEIDKNAIKAHNVLFPQYADRNLGDVSKVDWSAIEKPIDLLTYSSPCQDFSNAGLQRGGEEGSGTRSGLLWEVEKAIDALRPKYLVFENVAALVSDKFLTTFNKWQVRLNNYGYTNFCQLMNAKDYGVPQNRQRIFMVSVRDCDRAYYFPKAFKLEKRLKDVLESDVDERYYLSEERVKGLLLSTEKEKDAGRGFEFAPLTGEEECGRSVTTNAGCRKTDNFIAEPKVEVIGDLQPNNKRPISNVVRQQNMVVSCNGLAPCIPATHNMHPYSIAEPHVLGWTRNEKGEITDRHPVDVANCVTSGKCDNTQNYVCIPQATKDGYAVVPDGGVFDVSFPNSKTRRGRVQENGEVAPTVMTENEGLMVYKQFRIRRLTERELYRLMDVDEKDIDKLLASDIARTQHSKLAGNSIVVACLYYIFKNIFTDTEPTAGV